LSAPLFTPGSRPGTRLVVRSGAACPVSTPRARHLHYTTTTHPVATRIIENPSGANHGAAATAARTATPPAAPAVDTSPHKTRTVRVLRRPTPPRPANPGPESGLKSGPASRPTPAPPRPLDARVLARLREPQDWFDGVLTQCRKLATAHKAPLILPQVLDIAAQLRAAHAPAEAWHALACVALVGQPEAQQHAHCTGLIRAWMLDADAYDPTCAAGLVEQLFARVASNADDAVALKFESDVRRLAEVWRHVADLDAKDTKGTQGTAHSEKTRRASDHMARLLGDIGAHVASHYPFDRASVLLIRAAQIWLNTEPAGGLDSGRWLALLAGLGHAFGGGQKLSLSGRSDLYRRLFLALQGQVHACQTRPWIGLAPLVLGMTPDDVAVALLDAQPAVPASTIEALFAQKFPKPDPAHRGAAPPRTPSPARQFNALISRMMPIGDALRPQRHGESVITALGRGLGAAAARVDRCGRASHAGPAPRAPHVAYSPHLARMIEDLLSFVPNEGELRLWALSLANGLALERAPVLEVWRNTLTQTRLTEPVRKRADLTTRFLKEHFGPNGLRQARG